MKYLVRTAVTVALFVAFVGGREVWNWIWSE